MPPGYWGSGGWGLQPLFGERRRDPLRCPRSLRPRRQVREKLDRELRGAAAAHSPTAAKQARPPAPPRAVCPAGGTTMELSYGKGA